jgi:hypothetical protein
MEVWVLEERQAGAGVVTETERCHERAAWHSHSTRKPL